MPNVKFSPLQPNRQINLKRHLLFALFAATIAPAYEYRNH
jgi:hypothetical protein